MENFDELPETTRIHIKGLEKAIAQSKSKGGKQVMIFCPNMDMIKKYFEGSDITFEKLTHGWMVKW